MRRTWSKDPKIILETLSTFIDTGLLVTLPLSSNYSLRTRILRIHYYRKWPYLLILRPNGLGSSQDVQSLLFKMQGFPILGFTCCIERESKSILAVRLPMKIFELELRKNARVEPLQGSMATFFIKNKSRVSICNLENISMGGGKLVGRPTHHIKEKDIIGPCTFSLAGRNALILREVTVNNSSVVRIADEAGHSGQFGLGLNFDLSEDERDQLQEHVHFLLSH